MSRQIDKVDVYSHFINEGSEAHRGQVIDWPEVLQQAAEPGFEQRQSGPKEHVFNHYGISLNT